MLLGTGANQTTDIVDTLHDWNLAGRIRGMCFDTTSTNTGRSNGTCTLLEKELNTNLLHLACRHQVYELILRAVVEIYWPTTSGPNVPVFKRFQQYWPKIDVAQFEAGIENATVAEIVAGKKDEIINWISNKFQLHQPRDDDREFLELTCVFLGSVPPRGVTFKVPGAMHHARWLSKAIYCLKMFLFRKKFHQKARDMDGLRHICIFIVLFYVEAWFTAPSAIKAPNSDLNMLQRLIDFRKVNSAVSKAASAKLAAHLWYLSEELAPLAFFDDTVPADVRSKMVAAINERESGSRKVRELVAEKDFDTLLGRDISDFITKRSLVLFNQFELPYDFLQESPHRWETDERFQKYRMTFKELKVVNDIAEKGVALMKEYNKLLTNNEEQKQFLLQVVKDHRRRYPNTSKANLRD